MEKLFYEDQYIREFTAELVEVVEKDGTFHVVLDKTAFFPGGGGQFCDIGKIENIEVIDVYEENGTVYHVTKQKPIKIHRLKCSIDWKRRQDGMHQHLGQHVLSGCFFSLFNANTTGFHLGQDVSTVDIKGNLDEETIRKAEEFANEIIGEAREVKSFVPAKRELKKLNLRRDLPKTNEEIRVVTIDDLDINACCGVHPKSTEELRMIKIKRWEKHKDSTRIEFLAGSRAVSDALKKDKVITQICRYLSSNEEEAINSIRNLSEQIKVLNDDNRKIRDEIANYEIKTMIEDAEKIGGYSVVKHIYEAENVKYVSKVAAKLVENDNTIALMIVKDEDKVNFIFAASKNVKGISMNELLKDSISLVDGRGGGSPYLAQGGGKNNNNLSSAIDYAMMKLKNALK